MMTCLASQKGATFIEVLAAVSVFAVTAIGISPTLLSTRKMAAVSNSRSVAATLAADKIEQIRAGTSTCVADGPFNANGTTGGIYTRTCTSSAYPPSAPVTGIAQVSVTVSWPDRPTAQSVTLVTLVSQ
jgi:Tfp pilus assembly protein PilV